MTLLEAVRPVGVRWWFVLYAGLLSVQLPTILLSPIGWQDESQNNDLGRVSLLEPATDWGINLVSSGRAETVVQYLGVTGQELAYRLTAPSMIGSRIFSFLGMLLAAGALRQLLRQQGASGLTATLLGVGFLLDPLLAQSYRGGRIDCWAIGAMLLGCVLLGEARLTNRKAFLSGVCFSAAAFTWPSIVFLIPLVLLIALRRLRTLDGSRRLPLACAVFLGGLAAFVLFLLPALPRISVMLADLRLNVGEDAGRASGISLFSQMKDALRVVASRSPFSLLLALWAATYRVNAGLLAALAAATLMVCQGLVYEFRLIYVLPYVYLMAGSLLAGIGTADGKWMRFAARAALISIACWGIGSTLVVRQAVALVQSGTRSPDAPLRAVTQAIGAGPHRVYAPLQLYYAGRALGWRMFRGRNAGDMPTKRMCWAKVDYVLLQDHEHTEQAVKELHLLGFVNRGVIRCGAGPPHASWLEKFGGRSEYGPYYFYSKQQYDSRR